MELGVHLGLHTELFILGVQSRQRGECMAALRKGHTSCNCFSTSLYTSANWAARPEAGETFGLFACLALGRTGVSFSEAGWMSGTVGVEGSGSVDCSARGVDTFCCWDAGLCDLPIDWKNEGGSTSGRLALFSHSCATSLTWVPDGVLAWPKLAFSDVCTEAVASL